jgi:hypothetical protein
MSMHNPGIIEIDSHVPDIFAEEDPGNLPEIFKKDPKRDMATRWLFYFFKNV